MVETVFSPKNQGNSKRFSREFPVFQGLFVFVNNNNNNNNNKPIDTELAKEFFWHAELHSFFFEQQKFSK
jgi:hypothetical protein